VSDHSLTRRRALALLLVGATGAAVAAACSSAAPTAPAPTSPPQPQPTTAPATASKNLGQASQVMNWFAQPSQGGFWAADTLGYYRNAGLDFKTDQGGPGVSTIPLVASGKYTFGMTGADAILLSRAEDIPVVGLFAPYQTNPQGFMYHQESGIKDFPDLSGHTVFVAGAGAYYWDYIKAKYKLQNVEQRAYNGELATWLTDKNFVTQCFVISEPYFARKAGANPGVLLNANSGYNPYQNMMFTSEQVIRDKPDVVRAYVAACKQGWDSFLKDTTAQQKTFAAIKQVNKEQTDEQMQNELQSSVDLILTGDAKAQGIGTMNAAAWQTLAAQLKEIGALKKDVDVNAAFDLSFFQKAA
jgi:NitT/TauT family transport system substrate-binding protein